MVTMTVVGGCRGRSRCGCGGYGGGGGDAADVVIKAS